MQTTDIPDKEFALTERLYVLNGCKSPIEKIMRCVLEIVTGGICDGEINHREYRQYPSRRFRRRQEVKTYRRRCRQDLWIYAKNYKFDILRLLKFTPGAVTCFGKSNIKPLVYLMLSKEESRLLRDCTIMMNLSGQSNCVTFPSGTTLLHLACCTGNVEFVKMMLQVMSSLLVLSFKITHQFQIISVISFCDILLLGAFSCQNRRKDQR